MLTLRLGCALLRQSKYAALVRYAETAYDIHLPNGNAEGGLPSGTELKVPVVESGFHIQRDRA